MVNKVLGRQVFRCMGYIVFQIFVFLKYYYKVIVTEQMVI